MKKNAAVKNYVNAVGRLTARENPFEDNNEASDEAAINTSAALVRPRFGMYIAAALMLICFSLGAVILNEHIEKDSPISAVSDLPTKYTSIEQAIETYAKADRRYYYTLAEYDRLIVEGVGTDNDAAGTHKAKMQAKLSELENVRQAAAGYIAGCDTGRDHYLVDIKKYEGEDRLYLTVINKTDKSVKLLNIGTIYDAKTNEKLCCFGVMTPQTLESGKLTTVIITPTYIPEGRLIISLTAEEETAIPLETDTADIINTLPRESINILEKMLS